MIVIDDENDNDYKPSGTQLDSSKINLRRRKSSLRLNRPTFEKCIMVDNKEDFETLLQDTWEEELDARSPQQRTRTLTSSLSPSSSPSIQPSTALPSSRRETASNSIIKKTYWTKSDIEKLKLFGESNSKKGTTKINWKTFSKTQIDERWSGTQCSHKYMTLNSRGQVKGQELLVKKKFSSRRRNSKPSNKANPLSNSVVSEESSDDNRNHSSDTGKITTSSKILSTPSTPESHSLNSSSATVTFVNHLPSIDSLNSTKFSITSTFNQKSGDLNSTSLAGDLEENFGFDKVGVANVGAEEAEEALKRLKEIDWDDF